MVALLTVIHILVAVALILIVLLQSAKGTDLAGAFGGMGSQAAFGPRGTATFLSKATVGLAVVFMITSVTLSIMASRGAVGSDSLLSDEDSTPAAAQPTPATPSPAGAPPVQVQGMDGTGVNVTVQNPGDAAPSNAPAVSPAPAAPAGSAPAVLPAPASAPSGQ